MEYITEEGFIDFEKYPAEVEENKFILLENPNSDFEKILGAYDTEIEAYTVYKKVGHSRKKVIKANVIYKTICGLPMLMGYEKLC